jgi:hypothetical protein
MIANPTTDPQMAVGEGNVIKAALLQVALVPVDAPEVDPWVPFQLAIAEAGTEARAYDPPDISVPAALSVGAALNNATCSVVGTV